MPNFTVTFYGKRIGEIFQAPLRRHQKLVEASSSEDAVKILTQKFLGMTKIQVEQTTAKVQINE